MQIDRVLLVHVDLEELVVNKALVVLVPAGVCSASAHEHGTVPNSRVHFLEVCLDQVLP